MALDFNEFQRALKAADLPPKLEVILSLMYEGIRENNRQLDDMATIILGTVKTVENFVGLNEAMEGKIARLARRGAPEGVDVQSVAIELGEHKD